MLIKNSLAHCAILVALTSWASAIQASAASSPAPAQRPRVAPDRAATGSAIDEFFGRLEAHGFSGTVLVAQRGTILLHQGYGLADRQTGARIKPDTVFQIGSLDKQFIAAAILRLEMDGRLTVNDPLSSYLPAIAARHGVDLSGFAAGVATLGPLTLHQLLSHTSGLDNFYLDQAGSWKAYLERILREPLVAPPGTRNEYTNTGYDLLAQVVEIASNMPLSQYLERRFFAPLGMRDTGDTDRPWQLSRLARYQDVETHEFKFPVALPTERPAIWRAGEMLSTVGDLYRWHRALLDDRVLSAAARAKLFTVVKANYAYGWNVVRTARGTRLVSHGGYDTAIGVCAGLYRYVDEDTVFIVLANTIMNRRLNHEYLAAAVEAMVFGGRVSFPPAGVRLPAEQLSGLVGTYRLSGGGDLALRADAAGHLVVSSGDPRAILFLTFPDAGGEGSGSWGGDPRISGVLAGLERGDAQPLREVFAPDVNAAAASQRLLAGWAEMHRHLGAFLGQKTVYQTWFDDQDAPEVQLYLLLRFERGTQVIRALRDLDGHLWFDLVHLPEQLEMTFAAPALNSPDTFLAWNPKLGMGSQLVVRRGGDGTVTGLELRGRSAQVGAEREAKPTPQQPKEKGRA